jgi:DNA polymerase-3 subunit epsilon
MVKVRDGRMVDSAYWLIKPPVGYDEFWEWNTRIHGLVAADVVDALLWTEQLPDLVAFADGDILTAHNAGFDMGVISTACEATFVDTPKFEYACSLQVARKTYNLDSYRLPVAAMAAGFEDFEHHNALADAQACAAIMIHAAKRHGVETVPELMAAVSGKLGTIGAPARVEFAETA